MWNRIKNLFRQEREAGSAADLQHEIQTLRLDLEERERLLHELRSTLEYQRDGSVTQIADSVHAKMERIIEDMATPVSQIMTQSHLLDEGNQSLAAKDVMVLATRLIRVLEDQGMSIVGHVGEIMSFDPEMHEPLGAEESIDIGEQVVVRFSGIAFHGKFLRKMGIEKAGS